MCRPAMCDLMSDKKKKKSHIYTEKHCWSCCKDTNECEIEEQHFNPFKLRGSVDDLYVSLL